MKIFITGATGFIGSNIVKLLSGSHQFFAMVRTKEGAEKITALGAIPVICELGKVTSRHLEKCEAIIHAAAFTKEWGTKKQFWETTVYGTRQLVEVSKQSGIKKFIHISTAAILFTGEDLNNIDERYPYPAKSKFLYSESKLEAEKIVLAANQNNKFEVVVIRPRLVWGPGDQTILPILVNMVKSKKFLWINNGINLTSTTHIYNLAEGLKCVIDNWKPGEVYFITDAETSIYKDFLTQYISTQGITPPEKNVSKSLARLSANLIEFVWRILNLKSTPPLTRLTAYMLSSNFTINHSKAIKEINYKPVITVNKAMKELKEK